MKKSKGKVILTKINNMLIFMLSAFNIGVILGLGSVMNFLDQSCYMWIFSIFCLTLSILLTFRVVLKDDFESRYLFSILGASLMFLSSFMLVVNLEIEKNKGKIYQIIEIRSGKTFEVYHWYPNGIEDEKINNNS